MCNHSAFLVCVEACFVLVGTVRHTICGGAKSFITSLPKQGCIYQAIHYVLGAQYHIRRRIWKKNNIS